jgi:hypothetical protein
MWAKSLDEMFKAAAYLSESFTESASIWDSDRETPLQLAFATDKQWFEWYNSLEQDVRQARINAAVLGMEKPAAIVQGNSNSTSVDVLGCVLKRVFFRV